MTLTKIKKRDGEEADFDRTRIEKAIEKACDAVHHPDKSFIPTITDEIIADIERTHDKGDVRHIPAVETIQDVVEAHLMRAGVTDVAKAYILYRSHRKEERAEKQEELVELFEKGDLNVTKADGTKETFDIDKIRSVYDRSAIGYEQQCPFADFVVAFKKNIVEDIHTTDINALLVKTCVDLVSVDNIAWQHIAARIFTGNLYKQACRNRNISIKEIYTPDSYATLFKEYVDNGLYYKKFYDYYSEEDIRTAGEHLSMERDDAYEYTTVLSLDKRYLLNPNGVIKELPQEMYMSVALFLAIPEKDDVRLERALEIYKYCSEQMISLPTPTLLNARTNYHQLSSCFKINVDDDLRAIYHAIENMAQISKFGGGVGVYLGNIRARGAMIRGRKGMSGGVNPWIKVINDTAVAVNQLGSRLGAISVTLDIWHRDIHDFLDLQTETGDIRSKAFDVFPAVSIPDLFMERVAQDGEWTLFDPHEVEKITGETMQDKFNEDFDVFYKKCEADDRLEMKKTVKAKDLFKMFLKTTVETGMPYVFFRDTVNRLNPNAHAGNVYSTQLCTEICQNTSPTKFKEETLDDGKISITYDTGDLVTCNLASINVAKVHDDATIAKVFPTVFRVLDNVITLNYFPIKESERTANRYRSVGLGYLGLAEYLATRKISYETPEAREEVKKLFERFGYHTYRASVDIAKERGAYELYKGSMYDQGKILGRDPSWYKENTEHGEEWQELFADMKKYGVRFAYHTAPAPNTSTAGVVGTTAALLPIYKRYFVETNLSAPTVRVAPKLNKDNFWFYKEYISMDMNDVIDMMAEIYQWVDQSISFEWMIDPAKVSPAQLYEYYMRAHKKGIKTVYYVRSMSGEVEATCESCSG